MLNKTNFKIERMLSILAKIDTHGRSLERRKVQKKPSSEKEKFGGLGSSVDPTILNQIKNLCNICGQYRTCDDGCKSKE